MTQYLNTERVAEILCISKESARKFMREMPHVCIGGKAHETIRITVSDFEQEMERRKRYPTQEQENEVIRQRKKRNDLVARGLMNPDGTIARRRA
jgi:hypothetical protein